LGFGYPSGELTPFGPEAWVALFRLATFGAWSWLRTYALAFGGALLCSAFGTLAFTKRQFGTAAGVIAALLSLSDAGGWAEGGWAWHTEFGVWPVTLAMGFVLFALARLMDVLNFERKRDVGFAGVLIAISLLIHQLSLMVYPVAVPLLVLDQRLRTGKLSAASALRVLLACAVGFGLAAFYLLPMMARSDLTQDLGVLGSSLHELGRKLGEGGLFGSMWPPLFALGLVGGVLALFEPKQLRFFVPSVTLIFILLSSKVLISDLHLERLVSGLIKVEAHRFLLVAKLFWFPLVGHCVASLARLAIARKSGDFSHRRTRLVATLVLLTACTPLAWSAAREFYRTQLNRPVLPVEETQYWTDLSKVFDWSKQVRGATNEFYRIAYALPMHDHLSAIAPVFDPTFVYKVGYTPAQQFNRFPMTDEPEVLQALSVKYIVSDHPLSTQSYRHEKSFGKLEVYRLVHFRSEPFEIQGAGSASLEQFEPERVRIRVRGTDPDSRLRLSVASFPRWRATLDGAKLPISTVPVYDTEYPILMEVPVHDGVLEFRYVRRFIDWLGFGLTIATLGGLAGAIALHFWRPRQPAPLDTRANAVARAVALRLSAFARRLGRRGGAAIAALSALTIGLVLWRVAKPPLAKSSLFRPGLGVTLELAGKPCVPDGFAAWQCGEDRVEARIESGEYGAHSCMNTSAEGPLTVSIRTRAPRFVAGQYDTQQFGGQISLDFDEHSVGKMPTRDPSLGLQFFKFDTRASAGNLVNMKIALQGAPLYCFDLWLQP